MSSSFKRLIQVLHRMGIMITRSWSTCKKDVEALVKQLPGSQVMRKSSLN